MKRFLTLTEGELSVLADAVRLGRCEKATKRERLAAEQARTTLMEAYAPLAASMAEKFVGKLGRQEALSAAYYGLALALRSWNPDKGALPSWIRLYCKMTLLRDTDKQSLIKLPQALAPKRAMVVYLKNQGQTNEAIAKRLNIPVEQVSVIEAIPQVAVWIDADENDRTADGNEVYPSEASLHVEQLMHTLSEIERLVISARFGIGFDGLVHTYEEVAELAGLPESEVQVIEARCLRKLQTQGVNSNQG
jgi:DNA-directed RNA polymerase specialized sigma subunit